MDEKDLSILYRPDIKIERDYRSDGVILHELPDNQTEEKRQAVTPEIPDEITKAIQNSYNAGNQLLRIRKITEVLPTQVKPTVDDLLDTIMIWIGITIEKLKKVKENEPPDEETHEILGGPEYTSVTTEKPTDEEETTKPEKETEEIFVTSVSDEGTTDSEQSNDEWPTMTSSGFIFDVVKNKDIWDLARDQYLLDSSAIQEDFANEYNNVMEGYVYQLVSAMDEVGLDAPEYLNMEYEGQTVTGVPANYQHLNDIIVRNQDVVNEYADIFRKTHDEFETYRILATSDIASQERVRYLKEMYKSETAANYIEMYDKNYLAKSRDEHEAKYIAARTNVYKLLHSMSQITKEMLAAQLELAISKCSLLSKNVNIFAKEAYENMAKENSTSSTAKTDTKTETKQATDTVKKTDETPILTSGGGIGGAIKNTVKSVQEQAKTVSATNPKKVAEQKGQST